jgi:hypothetical protein
MDKVELNTPYFKQRKEQVDAWFFRRAEFIDMSQIDYILIKKHVMVPLVGPWAWKSLYESGEWILWQRIAETPQPWKYRE